MNISADAKEAPREEGVRGDPESATAGRSVARPANPRRNMKNTATSGPRNSETTGLLIGVLIGAVGLAMIAAPFIWNLDMMQHGFGLIFVGGFIMIAGLVTIGVFGWRAIQFRKLTSGDRHLVRWRHDPGVFAEQATRNFKAKCADNAIKFGIMLAFIVPITLLVTIIGHLDGEGDSMPFFVGLMALVTLVLAFAAVVTPLWDRWRAARNARETWISERSLYSQGTLHTWGGPASILRSVELRDDAGGRLLVFTIDYLVHVGLPGYVNHVVEVPVPPGEERRAEEIAARLAPIQPPA